MPDSVKFDPQGYIVSTQVASGQVLRIDPRTGERTVLADIAPGLDNRTFVGDRLFVSSISGQINEILGDGKIRSLVPDGLNWPLGLAMGEDGVLFVADGAFIYTLRPGGKLQVSGHALQPRLPRLHPRRGRGRAGRGVVTTRKWRSRPLFGPRARRAKFSPAASTGSTAWRSRQAERWFSPNMARAACCRSKPAKSRSWPAGLKEPKGVAIGPDGTCYVSESGGGRVVKLSGGKAETVLDGLQRPQGILLRGGLLYVVDAGAQELIEYDLASGARRTIASNLPVGAPPGVIPKLLGAIGTLSGPMGPFAGIAAGADGTLYVSADAEGSVLAIHPV